jgi:uridine kinase
MNEKPKNRDNRFVVSICGGSGCGKSSLAKLICEGIGNEWATRIPADYYLKSNRFSSLKEFFKHPLEYDWELIDSALLEMNGQTLTTPNFDFIHFQRIAVEGDKSYIMRPIAIIDAMIPYPKSNLTVFLDASDDERRKRIIERDKIWQTQVILNWEHHQITLNHVKSLYIVYDIILNAMQPVDKSVEYVISYLRQQFLYKVVTDKNDELR